MSRLSQRIAAAHPGTVRASAVPLEAVWAEQLSAEVAEMNEMLNAKTQLLVAIRLTRSLIHCV